MTPAEVFRKHERNDRQDSRERRSSVSPYRRSHRDSSSERHVEFSNNHLITTRSYDEYCLEGKIEGVRGIVTALLDSGSNANVISSRFFEKNVAPLHVLHSTEQRAVSYNGLSSPVLGSYQTEVIFDKTPVPVDFEVVKDIKYDAMLGRDVHDKNIKYINTKNGAIKFNDGSVVTILRKNVEPTGRQSSAANSEAVRFNTLRVHLQHHWFRSRYRVLPANWRKSQPYT